MRAYLDDDGINRRIPSSLFMASWFCVVRSKPITQREMIFTVSSLHISITFYDSHTNLDTPEIVTIVFWGGNRKGLAKGQKSMKWTLQTYTLRCAGWSMISQFVPHSKLSNRRKAKSHNENSKFDRSLLLAIATFVMILFRYFPVKYFQLIKRIA